ncbi:MAG TPA: nucleotide exchange factor GrpE [Bryobacteraceae bacterium]|jgi:molecular chaperone GrpE
MKHQEPEAPEERVDGEIEGRDTSTVVDPSEALAALTAERDRLAAEKAEVQDRLLRSQAEFQNLRRRIEKEKAEWHEYAATEAVRALLPILDDFERALKIEAADKHYTKGMELIYQRLLESLKKLGLEPIVCVGQPFNPHVHHAVEKFETEDAPDGTVLEEYQRGYNFKGQLLRAAMVKVAAAPAEAATD